MSKVTSSSQISEVVTSDNIQTSMEHLDPPPPQLHVSRFTSAESELLPLNRLSVLITIG